MSRPVSRRLPRRDGRGCPALVSVSVDASKAIIEAFFVVVVLTVSSGTSWRACVCVCVFFDCLAVVIFCGFLLKRSANTFSSSFTKGRSERHCFL